MSQQIKGIVPINGKDYRTVAFRVNEFRSEEKYDGWCINTDIIEKTDVDITMKSVVTDQNGIIRGTGIANEVKGRGKVNSTSHIENCETSAIGRALACIGLAGTEYASADELANALVQQSEMAKATAPEFEVVEDGPDKDSETQEALDFLCEKIGYSTITKKITGTEKDLDAALKEIGKDYPANTARLIAPFADVFRKNLKTTEGKDAKAA